MIGGLEPFHHGALADLLHIRRAHQLRPHAFGADGEAGIFRQEMSNTVNEAVMSYSEKKQTIILRAPKIEFEGYGYEDKPYVTLEQINDAFSDIDDNKTGISNLQDDTAKTKGKPSLQEQLDALEKRVKALGG